MGPSFEHTMMFDNATCTNPLTTHTVFAKFNHTCKIRHHQNIVPHFDVAMLVTSVQKITWAVHINPAGRGMLIADLKRVTSLQECEPKSSINDYPLYIRGFLNLTTLHRRFFVGQSFLTVEAS